MNSKKLVVISSYPEKGFIHGRKTVGVASYTKNTLLALKRTNKNLKIVVLGEILDRPEQYLEEGIQIKRIWRRSKFIDIFKIPFAVQKEKSDKVVVAFEAYMFGGFLKLFFFLLTLLIMKLSGKKIYIILHQIIEDFRLIEKNKLKARLLNILKTIFYQVLIGISHKTIVFEERFKKALGDKKKIITIPHAVEKMRAVSQVEARKRLGFKLEDFYVLYFGFLSPYKGANLLVELWNKNKEERLILAGGGNPNHMKDKKYARFVKNTLKKARTLDILTPGFIPEKEIPLYFSAVDLFILPYQVFMSSSGPLSMAFGFEKPVLLSRQLAGYFETDDMKEVLKEAGLKPSDIFFDFNQNHLNQKLKWARKNIFKLKKFSLLIKEKRNWRNIGKTYLKVLDE
jgi:glycosyltransferase involved in cell wall biosynthesis